mgnify:CR=1 FL=1|tara:strand:+ start:9733 stop:10086 length:354 start_codon:yes stop_codon:yes gene_type:complete
MSNDGKINLNYNKSETYRVIRIGQDLEDKQANKDEICNHDTNQVVSIDKDTLHYILRDEMMNRLLTELGINMFNDWFSETIGGEPPFMYVKNSFRGARMKKLLYLKDIKEELIEGDK